MKLAKPKIELLILDEPKEKGEAWSKARQFEIDDTIENTTIEDVYNIAMKFNDIRDRCLFISLYLTAARVEEIVRYQKIKWGKKKVRVIEDGKNKGIRWVQDFKKPKKIGALQDGIRRKDIREKIIRDILCVSFNIRNLKNRREKFKKVPVRLDHPIQKKLWNILKLYIDTLYEYEELFPFQKRNAERILNKVGWNPHSLRDLRLTHLVKYYNLQEQKLTKIAGWSDSRPAKHYVKLREEDLI